MKRLMMTAMAFAAVAAADAASLSDLKLKAKTDKTNPIGYKVGEKMRFDFFIDGVKELPEEAASKSPLKVQWTRTGDDGRKETGVNEISLDKGFTVETKLDVPGIVLIEAQLVGSDGKKFDYEARVGEVTGPVTVCKTNHHSYFDSMGNAFIKATRPQLFLSSSWSPNQQNVLTLSRMASQKNYMGPRFVAYGFIPESRMREFEKQGLADCLAPAGHAVVKVAPGGSSFKLYTLTTRDESMSIVGTRDFTC